MQPAGTHRAWESFQVIQAFRESESARAQGRQVIKAFRESARAQGSQVIKAFCESARAQGCHAPYTPLHQSAGCG